MLGENTAPKFLGTAFYTNGTGAKVERKVYNFPKRETCLMAKVPEVLGKNNAPKFFGTQKYGNNNIRKIYNFPKRDIMPIRPHFTTSQHF